MIALTPSWNIFIFIFYKDLNSRIYPSIILEIISNHILQTDFKTLSHIIKYLCSYSFYENLNKRNYQSFIFKVL